MRAMTWIALAGLVAIAGCEEPVATREPAQASSDVSTPAANSNAPTVYPGGVVTDAYNAPPASAANPAAAPAAPQPEQAQPPASQPPLMEKAEAGVGVKGDTLEYNTIQAPAKAYFQIREKAAFLQVDQAINLYRGLEGRLPQSTEEFMEKIIRANNIQLPELAPGSRYVWDVEKGELMVERPQP